jgi:putative endopeptidase
MKKALTVFLSAGAVMTALANVPQVAPWGVSLNYVDTKTRPGDDFFKYSNGGWLKSASIPPDRQVAGVNLEIDKSNETKMSAVVVALLTKDEASLTADERKLRDFFNAYQDVAAVEAKGLAPLKGDLERIAELKNPDEVAAYMGDPSTYSGGPFELGISIDDGNPNIYRPRFVQSGLGLPDRDYYLSTDKELVSTREAYKVYIANMLKFVNVDDPQRIAAVYELEKHIAELHWPAAERRDAERIYNPMSVSELEKLAPAFPWQAYLKAAGVSLKSPQGERIVVVNEKSSFAPLAKLFAATPTAVWRDYLRLHLLRSLAGLLPEKINDANFAFYGVIVGGQKKQMPRDLRALELLDRQMGEALGRLYCEKYFPAESKAKLKVLVDNLVKAYAAEIRTLAWMSPETRAKALEKVMTFYPKIGYPDKWRDYSALSISRTDLIGDDRNSRLFEWHRELKRIDEPVDRTEWDMTPQTNNAEYNPALNEIVFPAGGLQPPFFDPNADDAVNYGGIGATIGHEMSHGFDDQGSKYDASGRLHEWWTAEDRKRFEALTSKIAQQYSQFEPLPGLHLNGRLTLGENIADIAGLVIANRAYHLSLNGKSAPVLDGYSGDQRFFLAYGQSWREIMNDNLTRRLVVSNEHSPDQYRVNGVVRNLDAWYEAFSVKSEAKLYLPPPQRVPVW